MKKSKLIKSKKKLKNRTVLGVQRCEVHNKSNYIFISCFRNSTKLTF